MSVALRPGRVEEITSPSNPRIKSIKGLWLKKNREAEGAFLAEGMKLVQDALEAGWTVRTLLHAKCLLKDARLKERVTQLATTVRARGGDVLMTNNKLLTAITRRDNAQAVVAVLEPRMADVSALKAETNVSWVALDRVRDPGNLGTIIRTVDALGASGIILVGDTTDPFAVEAVRATMGSLFHVPLISMAESAFYDLTNHWRLQGGAVIGTHLKGAVDHRSIDYKAKPHILLMGNEQQGLTDDLAATCDQLALIAMAGKADSLNLAVATGIMLFEARRHALQSPEAPA
ncbi:MAG: RNA methyltransferase [Pseudomonadota bacterium]